MQVWYQPGNYMCVAEHHGHCEHFTRRCVTSGASTGNTPVGAISGNKWWLDRSAFTCNYLMVLGLSF